MTEITDLSVTDSSNTTVTGESIDGAIANMGRMDNTLQAILGLLARSIRTNVLRFLDNTDPTKKVALDLSGLPTATTRTWTAPYYSGTLGLVSDIRGQIYGLTLSNNVTDATNDIDIAAGSAVDNNGAVSMLLASGLTKQLDAVWAVGNNAGMRASGAAIANTTYHIFLIRRPDTGVVDIAADTSATGANIAANTNAAYTQIRRIGSILRAAGTIRAFRQVGKFFRLTTSVLEVSETSVQALSAVTLTSVPSGIRVKPRLQVGLEQTGGASSGIIAYLTDGDSVVAGSIISVLAINNGPNVSFGRTLNETFITNTSAQIGRNTLAVGSPTGPVFTLVNFGWEDFTL